MQSVFYLEKSEKGTSQITIKSKLLERRIIVLDCKVSAASVGEIIAQISLLAAESNEPITLFINSPGGSVQDGLVLVDVMRSSPCVIKTVALGLSASMAAVILAAGTKGHRYITESGKTMLHQPQVTRSVGGNCTQMEEMAKNLVSRKKQLNSLLRELTGSDEKTIEELTSKDTYLTAKQALRHGLVDTVAKGEVLNRLLVGAA